MSSRVKIALAVFVVSILLGFVYGLVTSLSTFKKSDAFMEEFSQTSGSFDQLTRAIEREALAESSAKTVEGLAAQQSLKAEMSDICAQIELGLGRAPAECVLFIDQNPRLLRVRNDYLNRPPVVGLKYLDYHAGYGFDRFTEGDVAGKLMQSRSLPDNFYFTSTNYYILLNTSPMTVLTVTDGRKYPWFSLLDSIENNSPMYNGGR